MIFNDKIYGKEKISEPVILELISCPDFQRLKGISQQGMPQEYYHLPTFTRYDHSIGVLIILKRLNATIKEQIAGLLHDVSHTAFSHVVDWVIGDPQKEDHQDNQHEEIIKNSSISKILDKYGFDYKEIAHLEAFHLLDLPIPALCADRFDYALREIIEFESPAHIKDVLANLKNENGRMIFSSLEIAERFSKNYSKCQREHWAGKEAKARYHILSSALKEALANNFITLEDFLKTDQEVLDKISSKNNKLISECLSLLKNGFKIKEVEKEGILLQKKFRFLDPYVKINNKIKKLSELSKSYKNFIDSEKENSKKESYIKIEPLINA